jgi:hypothetical protein
MKKTPWFPVRTPPVRVGWYEFRLAGAPESMMAKWDGTFWTHAGWTFTTVPGDHWRGLAQDPSKT